MTDLLKQYIKTNLELIDNSDFIILYDNLYLQPWYDSVGNDVCQLTELLKSCGLDPLMHMKEVPEKYLYTSTQKSVIIPSGIEFIGRSAFEQMQDLEEIVIPSSCNVVNPRAFHSCPRMHTLTIMNPNIRIGNDAFLGCYGICDVYFSGSLVQWKRNGVLHFHTMYTVHCTDGNYICTSMGTEIYEA